MAASSATFNTLLSLSDMPPYYSSSSIALLADIRYSSLSLTPFTQLSKEDSYNADQYPNR